jgi:DnaJ-class molecular chaperone
VVAVQVLGVASNANDRDLKRAYHKLALEFHPDKVLAEQKEEAEKKFREIAEVPTHGRSCLILVEGG